MKMTSRLAEIDGRIAGCGGWSRRATLHGGDHSGGREEERKEPEPGQLHHNVILHD